MSKKLHFNVSAYTARLIGRENVSNLEGAILELVKNTYDADASKCILYYEKDNDTLYLMDNGTGMTESVIEKHWMTIGNSSKSMSYTTKSGRIQTGAKGIGRFALDRISDNCIMYTKNEVDKETIQWIVNWKDFENAKKLTDITADINYLQFRNIHEAINIKNEDVNKLLKEFFKTTGTIFKITNFRDEWNDDLIENIRKSLSSLIPPDMEKEFAIYLFNDEQTEKEALIISQNVDTYDYKIQFNVEESGKVEIRINRNEFDFKDKIDEIIVRAEFTKEDKKYFLGEDKLIDTTINDLLNFEINDMGQFNGTLYFNKITMGGKDDAKKYYYKDITGRKNYSNIFGGIKLYRDNFRVRPYGEKDSSSYDWLLLGNRRAKSPSAISHSGKWRVGAEQITGIVNISRMNVNLPDQANRQGIVETPQFKALKEVIISVIEKFEEDRQYVGRKLAALYEKDNEIEKIEKNIRDSAEKIDKSEKQQTEDRQVNLAIIDPRDVQKVFDNKDEKIKALEDDNKMLRNLATTGIVTNQYIHETKQAVNSIGLSVSTAMDVLQDRDIESALKFLEMAQNYVKTLSSWFDVTIGSIRRDKRNMKYTDIGILLSNQVTLWKRALEEQKISISLEVEDDLSELKCFPYEIESIISNLIANSKEAFRGIKDKKISIILKNKQDGIFIEYFDTGKGLSEAYRKEPEKILEPFETDKRNLLNEKVGTGMGMWIIKNIVDDYNGKIDLSTNKTLKQGFWIGIELRTLKKESE